MKTGWHFRELAVTGEDKPRAYVRFNSGLNVVAGASNTGKTYIYHILNYILGSGTTPKQVAEADGYTHVQAEASTAAGDIVSLIRPIAGGDFFMFHKALRDIDLTEDGVGTPLLGRADKNKKENISTFLLRSMDIPDAKLKAKPTNETHELSARNIIWMVLVNEERIITERSPIFSGDSGQILKERSLFEFMITGRDFSGFEIVQDQKTRRTDWTARVSVFDELIQETEAEIATKQSELPNRNSTITSLEQDIFDTNTLVAFKDDVIQSAIKDRRKQWERKQTLDSRVIVLNELLQRFDLLRNQYNTDLRRLQFVAEAEHYFSQLDTVLCPFCSRPLDEHEAKQLCEDQNLLFDDIQKASRAESEKIAVHLRDLESTIGGLLAEVNEKQNLSLECATIIDRIDLRIRQELEPEALTVRHRLERLLDLRRRLIEIENIQNRLERYRSQRKALGTKVTSVPKTQKFLDNTEESLKGLASTIQTVLKGWTFPDADAISFDSQLDLVISGRTRQSQGKGVRAVLYAAFTIGLMRYCLTNDLPHPGFVVLDSPITTFSGATGKDAVGSEEVKNRLEENFYSYLASSGENEQIIILENKLPPEALRAKINFIHFTGEPDNGRRGFFPDA